MSLKSNLLYSAALTLSAYLVPLLVYPYIARVLGASGIGAVDTVESFINYAVLVSMMGLTTIGAREIARVKDEPLLLQKVFSSLFSLNVISTLLVLGMLGIMVYALPQFRERSDLMLIGMFKVLFSMFCIEWFFKGIENFRYITVRSVCMRLLFIAAVYLLVRDKDDYILYYVLWVLMIGGNAACNWFYRRRYTGLSFKAVRMKPYVKPFIYLGLFALFSAVYTQLNVLFLGLSCGPEEVGYYTMATKLYTVLMALFSTLTTVMIPRMTVLLKDGTNISEVKALIMKVFHLLFLFSFPVVIFTELFSAEIVFVIAGKGFEQAVIPMRIVMPLVFIIGTEQIFMMQLLVPLRKDHVVFFCAFIGALVCLLVNALVVRHLQSMGTALAWVAAELAVFLLSSYHVWKSTGILFPLKVFFRYSFLSIPYFVLGGVALLLWETWAMRLSVAMIAFGLYGFFLEERVLKLKLMAKLFQTFKRI